MSFFSLLRMDPKDSKWTDPQWTASAEGYRFRPHDEREAISYLTICYHRRQLISLRNFAYRFGWGTDKAYRFLRRAGIKIIYPKGKKKGSVGLLF